jgi:predicted nucleic acid-binding Zn ribbon protein
MIATGKCLVCLEPLPPPPPGRRGRPRKYCSNRCRLRAQRERQHSAVLGVMIGGAPLPGAAELAPEDLLGPRARDPDEAVVESIVLARGAAAAFGLSAQRARPQLSWRCAKMADHIAAGLDRYFRPQR